MWNFLSNSEYISNDYKVGEPYFGTQVRTRIAVEPVKNLKFSIGVFLRKYYGDEEFLSDVYPLFKMSYKYKNFSCIFGELINEPKLPDAMLKEQYPFTAAPDEGILMNYNSENFQNTIWGIYPELHTPQHREHLCVGNSASYKKKNIELSFLFYASHYGGQLYSSADERVRDNHVASLGFKYSYIKLKMEQFLIGSNTTESRKLGYERGYGSISRISFITKYLNYIFQYYQGCNYQTWEGNPFYTSNDPYYFIEVSKKYLINKNIDIDFGVRADFVEVSPIKYFDKSEHILWLNIIYRY